MEKQLTGANPSQVKLCVILFIHFFLDFILLFKKTEQTPSNKCTNPKSESLARMHPRLTWLLFPALRCLLDPRTEMMCLGLMLFFSCVGHWCLSKLLATARLICPPLPVACSLLPSPWQYAQFLSCCKHGCSICAPTGIWPATVRIGHLLWEKVRSSISLIPPFWMQGRMQALTL